VDVGVPELLIVLVVILVIFGGAKIPQLARSLGQAATEFKKGTEHGLAADPKTDATEATDIGAPSRSVSPWPPSSNAGPPELN
jgi:sec-independent protein translocase protein TatA